MAEWILFSIDFCQVCEKFVTLQSLTRECKHARKALRLLSLYRISPKVHTGGWSMGGELCFGKQQGWRVEHLCYCCYFEDASARAPRTYGVLGYKHQEHAYILWSMESCYKSADSVCRYVAGWLWVFSECRILQSQGDHQENINVGRTTVLYTSLRRWILEGWNHQILSKRRSFQKGR